MNPETLEPSAPELAQTIPVPAVSKRSRYVELVLFPALSAVVPGSGQMLAGRIGVAALWFAAFCGILSAQWMFRLPFTHMGLFLDWALWTALALASCIHAYIVVRRKHRTTWWILPIAVAVGLLAAHYLHGAVWRLEGVKAFTVPSTAMEPTIRSGESVVVDLRWFHSRPVERGDLIVYYRDDTYFVKRVIGKTGDRLEGKNGTVLRNGEVLNEEYAVAGWPVHDFVAITVPEGELFVAGDNRPASYDSRTAGHGFVKTSEVIGKPIYVVKSPEPSRGGQPLF